MRIDVLTIFPDLITGYTDASILGRAQRDERLEVRVHDLRSVTLDPHRSVDDSPFGGGAGMVLKPGPIFETVAAVKPPRPIFYLSPSGRRFDQAYASELAQLPEFSLLCGRYEGVDERVREEIIDDEISIGDYVLAGGELAALTVIEAVARLLPGVLGNAASSEDESFSDGLLEYPQYTRPADYESMTVPEVLLSGNHARIDRWRLAKSLERTLKWRPDLIEARGGISEDEAKMMLEFGLDPAEGGSSPSQQ